MTAMTNTSVMLMMIAGCASPAPNAPPSPSPPSSSPTAVVETKPDEQPAPPAQTASLDAAVVNVDAAATGSRARSAPIEPALVFRRISGGVLSAGGFRDTWTISKHEGSELVVKLVLDEAMASFRISGAERTAATWQNVGDVTWSGTFSGSGDGLHAKNALHLETQNGIWGSKRSGASRKAPPTLTIDCKSIKLPVLVGTANLIPGDACGNGGKRPFWKPATKKPISVLRCTFAEVPPSSSSGWDGEPSFAREPGVEWVFENSDCTAQEGAYRQIAP